MAVITAEQLADADAALRTGQRDLIARHFAGDMRGLVPGHDQLSGQKNNLDEFIGSLARVGEGSKHSFHMRRVATMAAEDYSADVTHNTGHRAGEPDRVLDIDVTHWMRWRDGTVIHARGAIFGNGTAHHDTFGAEAALKPQRR